jgi:hypothetical protein
MRFVDDLNPPKFFKTATAEYTHWYLYQCLRPMHNLEFFKVNDFSCTRLNLSPKFIVLDNTTINTFLTHSKYGLTMWC